MGALAKMMACLPTDLSSFFLFLLNLSPAVNKLVVTAHLSIYISQGGGQMKHSDVGFK